MPGVLGDRAALFAHGEAMRRDFPCVPVHAVNDVGLGEQDVRFRHAQPVRDARVGEVPGRGVVFGERGDVPWPASAPNAAAGSS
jgi:hypothetical protein